MMNLRWQVAILPGLLLSGLLSAQTPAPVLGTTKDSDGKALPFGRQPYKAPDTPLGTGRYKAIMATDESLPAHVVYYPVDLDSTGKLPIIAWGNDACANAGNRFRYFLTEIASHGYIVIASGIMAPITVEVGPQENPAVITARGPQAPPADDMKRQNPTVPDQLTQAIDWAVRENSRQGGRFFNKVDVSSVAVAGHSCGGIQALQVAADPRIKTLGVFSIGPLPAGSDWTALLSKLHSSVLYVTGDLEHDAAYRSAEQAFELTASQPAFRAWKDDLTQVGTYGMSNGGELATIAAAWFDWQLKGDQKAGKRFKGADCTMCKDSTWHVIKKNID